MSDQGFDFRPPPPRRDARRFEPPPWERDQFEQRKREQEEREAAAEAARAKVLAEEEAARTTRQAGEPKAAEADDQAPVSPLNPKGEVDEKQVAMMMLNLRAEEPPALENVWMVNLAAGSLVALIGFASAIWGAAALSRRGLPAAGTLGGMVLVGFGLGFMGLGGWLIYKALLQRGVL